jgi:aldehyde dehydrogenase (NAD+)
MSGFDYIRREPDGVVGILASSVAPFASAAAALAAAVAAGNCVVMIASGAAPFTPIRLAQLCHLAGLPPGVVNVVVGDEELATQLACRQGLDKICVSGSSADGRRTLVAAASQVRPVLLQLQGMSVDLVFPDADLAAVAASICRALVAASAAGRDVPSRVVVADSCHDDLVACLINELQRLVVGPACSPDTDVGPRPTAAHLERLAAAWARVEQAGGRVFSGARPSDVVNGGRPSGVHAGGWFAWPALATGLGAGEVAGFEDLGVLLSVIPFNCEEDAIALASAAPHTTLARLHTTNLERTHTVTAEIPVPAVVVGLDDIDRGSQPFTVDDFLHRKNVFVDLSA